MGFPVNITGRFTGTAQTFQASLANQPLLILAALVTVYLVLGVLYESFIHPFTSSAAMVVMRIGRNRCRQARCTASPAARPWLRSTRRL